MHRSIRVPSKALSAAILAAGMSLARVAWAECVVLPGVDGEVSTWLVQDGGRVAPIASGAAAPTLSRLLDRHGGGQGDPHDLDLAAPSPLWRPAAASTSSLDVQRALRRRGPGVAYAALALTTARPATRWLSLGSDDAVAVWLDGRELFRRVAIRASRADDDLVAIPLDAGAHRLVIKMVTRGDADLIARVVGEDHRPDPTLRIALPGVSDDACAALTSGALRLGVSRRVEARGLRALLHLRWPGGLAHPSHTRELPLQVGGDGALETVVALGGPSAAPLDASVPLGDDASTISVRVGATQRRVSVAVGAEVQRALREARETLTAIDPGFAAEAEVFPRPRPTLAANVPLASLWSVERDHERLAELVGDGDRDAAFIDAQRESLRLGVDALREGRDPYADRRGALRRAYRSPLDGSLQEYSVYVPPSYRREGASPVVVGLHGLHGTSHRMLPILLGFYDESESRTRADRHLPALPDAAAILVAPYGFGDSGYRHQGEHDVLAVLDEVQSAYRTDPNRAYITGLSMGGIGAASVPLHHPDRFAASAALCGYHSYFVRGDTRGRRRPWEEFLMSLRSNDRVAENGRHLPMYIVQGTLDRPLSHSQVLATRYQALGYSLETEWPTLGHNVWSTTYAGGRIVPWFLRHRRDPAPPSVRFRTHELRWRRSAWVAIDALAARDGAGRTVATRSGTIGEVDARIDRRGAGRVTTEGVFALTLAPPRALVGGSVERVSLTLDGEAFTIPLDARSSFVRDGARWRASPRALEVPAGGPIREVFDTPMVFVVGTADPSLSRLHERVARAWAHRRGVPTRYPVVTDTALTSAMVEGRTLVFVGTPRTNTALARLAPRLPIRFDADAVLVGSRRYVGEDLGVVFSAAHPDHPSQGVIVIAGSSPRALLRSLSLPELLPEYVVYDERVAPARGRVILGERAEVIAAGFFDATGAPLDGDAAPPGGRNPR